MFWKKKCKLPCGKTIEFEKKYIPCLAALLKIYGQNNDDSSNAWAFAHKARKNQDSSHFVCMAGILLNKLNIEM